MNCTRCGKPMFRPAMWIGGYPFGPKCARAMFGAKQRRKASEVVRDERTKDLFA